MSKKHPIKQINAIAEDYLGSCLEVGMRNEAKAWRLAREAFSQTLADQLGPEYLKRILYEPNADLDEEGV